MAAIYFERMMFLFVMRTPFGKAFERQGSAPLQIPDLQIEYVI
jgi:hypothetical protein